MKILFDKLEINAFDSEGTCLKFIADQKWAEGYTCRKCGMTLLFLPMNYPAR
jgi:hypothetical protein